MVSKPCKVWKVFLFCGLSYSSNSMQHWKVEWFMNDECESIWKKGNHGLHKILLKHLAEGAHSLHKKLSKQLDGGSHGLNKMRSKHVDGGGYGLNNRKQEFGWTVKRTTKTCSNQAPPKLKSTALQLFHDHSEHKESKTLTNDLTNSLKQESFFRN